MSSQKNAIQAGAELLVEAARQAGEASGVTKEIAAVTVLEVALAFAWAEAIHFRGANDTPERMNEAIKTMQRRIAEEIVLQHYLLKGAKPFLKGH